MQLLLLKTKVKFFKYQSQFKYASSRDFDQFSGNNQVFGEVLNIYSFLFNLGQNGMLINCTKWQYHFTSIKGLVKIIKTYQKWLSFNFSTSSIQEIIARLVKRRDLHLMQNTFFPFWARKRLVTMYDWFLNVLMSQRGPNDSFVNSFLKN